MSKEKNKSKQIPGGVISSKEDWAKYVEDWTDRSYEERLSAVEILRLQFLEMNNISPIPDMSIFGKR